MTTTINGHRTVGRHLTLGGALAAAESPIERIFIEDAIMLRGPFVRLVAADTIDEFYDGLCVRSEGRFVVIAPQVSVGPYRCDFLAGRRTIYGKVKVIDVECDGFEFHRMNARQMERDRRRDRVLRTECGVADVMRFEGSRIHADIGSCIDEVLTALGAFDYEMSNDDYD